MPIQVLSWNIKSFVACLTFKGNRLDILKRIMHTFDLISIYEVPNTSNGNNCLGNLVNELNNIGGKTYAAFSVPTGGIGKENDQVAVVYDTATIAAADTTGSRRLQTTGGRDPVYFDVTANGKTREFCAWHAPQPGHGNLIAQGWQNILKNSLDQKRNPLTDLVMGDFNAALTVPNKRGPGRQLRCEITNGIGTTLRPNAKPNQTNVLSYRTNNMYDQFYADHSRYTTVGKSGVYDVLNKLATNAAPFAGLYGTTYNSNHKAYQYYYGSISDHLPVGIILTF